MFGEILLLLSSKLSWSRERTRPGHSRIRAHLGTGRSNRTCRYRARHQRRRHSRYLRGLAGPVLPTARGAVDEPGGPGSRSHARGATYSPARCAARGPSSPDITGFIGFTCQTSDHVTPLNARPFRRNSCRYRTPWCSPHLDPSEEQVGPFRLVGTSRFPRRHGCAGLPHHRQRPVWLEACGQPDEFR